MQTSNQPSTPRLNKFAIIFGIFSLLGFLDASYLTLEHYLGAIPTCSIVHGCSEVLTSAFSTVAGIPVALFGSIYYLAVLVLTIMYFDDKKKETLALIGKVTVLGLIASLYFLFVQAFMLHAFCLYCLGSLTTSTVLFITGWIVLRKTRA